MNILKKLVVLLPLLMINQVLATEIKVQVEGVEPGAGTVYLSLMNKAAYEDDKPVVAEGQVVKDSEQWLYVFTDVPEGEYAIMSFQDLNGDKEPNFSIFSGAVEPLGVSRNAAIGLFPPAWNKVKVLKEQENLRVSIKLQ